MSGPTAEKAKLGPPPRWLRCPRVGQAVENQFIPLKTPLCDLYDDQIPEIYRFNVSMVFNVYKNAAKKIGLWVDLTNTDRFYRREEVEQNGANYVKLNCKGHSECPNEEQTRLFINICKQFFKTNPEGLVAVHCTHGFNRTGFLIVAYLVLEKDWSIDAAIQAYANARPPGIYKEDYLRELYKRFDNVDYTPLAPALPDWCNESDPILDDNEAEARNNMPSTSSKKCVACVEGVPEIKIVRDTVKVRQVQQLCQKFCSWKKKDFPGSQPVSMEVDNLKLLQEKLYQVTWKADGVRYLMLINGENEIYMMDRDSNVFKVPNMKFPHRKEGHIKSTLVDGELIFDEVSGKKVARYLIYDIVRFEDQPVGGCDFGRRMQCIKSEIIEPRHRAMSKGMIVKESEPLSVRAKDFWDITQVENLLSEEFAKKVPHEIDGLIFQPYQDPYEPGRCMSVLKWKPHHLNSVDFKLQITKEHKQGMLPEFVGYLYVLGLDHPFDKIKATKELKQYDKKIIECNFENGHWKFMRERRDKSFPNAYQTAIGVCKSIQTPVTKQILVDFVRQRAKKPNMAKSSSSSPTSAAVNGVVRPSSNGSSAPKRQRVDDNGEHSDMPPPMYVPSSSKH